MATRWKEWVLIVVGGVMAVRTGMSVWRLWKAGERVEEAQVEVDQASDENRRLKERLVEVQSPEFVEREAREKLGWGKEGETILVIPDQREQESIRAGERENEVNWRKWWRLYVGR